MAQLNYKHYRRTTKDRIALKRKLINMMGGCCVDCGYSSHLAALDFDHKDPKTKSFQVSIALTSMSIAACEAEAFKCEIRCANCHRIKTHPDATDKIFREN